MASPLMFVRDGRTMPFIPVTAAAMRAIREHTARGRPYATATYMALLEFANESRDARVALTQREIVERVGASRSTVQNALAQLVGAGVLQVVEQTHGSARIENEYVVVEPAEGGAESCTPARETGDPRPSDRQLPQEGVEGTSSSSSSAIAPEYDFPPAVAGDAQALLRARTKVAGRIVTPSEMEIAAAALDEFNTQSGSEFALGPHLTAIVGRVRERPTWDAGKHRRLVASAWRFRWWEQPGRRAGRPAPAVVYGNAKCFENCVQDAVDEANGKRPPGPPVDERTERRQRRASALRKLSNREGSGDVVAA